MLTKIKRRFSNIFITGLLITLPIALTWFILKFLFQSLDALSPVFTEWLMGQKATVGPKFFNSLAGPLSLFLLLLTGVGPQA